MPLRILLSKIREYHLEEMFYKHIKGYADLLAQTQSYNSLFFDRRHRKNTYFGHKKQHALDVIEKYKAVMERPWPHHTKQGTQALSGLMSLIGNIESQNIFRSISLTTDELTMDSRYLYQPGKHTFIKGVDLICRVKRSSFLNFDEAPMKINLLAHLPDNERYHHSTSNRIKRSPSPGLKLDSNRNDRPRGRSKSRYARSKSRFKSRERSRSSSNDRSRSNSRSRSNLRKLKRKNRSKSPSENKQGYNNGTRETSNERNLSVINNLKDARYDPRNSSPRGRSRTPPDDARRSFPKSSYDEVDMDLRTKIKKNVTSGIKTYPEINRLQSK